MKRKAKELQLAKREARKGGRTAYTGGFGSSDYRGGGGGGGTSVDSLPPPEHKPAYSAPRSDHSNPSSLSVTFPPPPLLQWSWS